jgi:hypothetical protein
MECKFCYKTFSKGEHLRVTDKKKGISFLTADYFCRDMNAVVRETIRLLIAPFFFPES